MKAYNRVFFWVQYNRGFDESIVLNYQQLYISPNRQLTNILHPYDQNPDRQSFNSCFEIRVLLENKTTKFDDNSKFILYHIEFGNKNL